MNDQQIYALMLATPALRAVQIADKLDVPLVDVSAALRSLVAVGDVVRSSGTAPNGQPAQLYDLSPEFRKSRECVKLTASIAAKGGGAIPATQAPAAPPAPTPVAPAADPAPPPPPEAAKPTDAAPADVPRVAPPPGRQALAIAYIKEHGRATDAQLRVVMGLKKTEYPSAYLSRPAQLGQVAKVGHEWQVGDGKPVRSIAKLPPFGGSLGLPGATPFPRAPAAAAPEQANAAAPTQALVVAELPVSPAAAFRCGLWSDGVIELQRNGVTVAAVQKGEAETLLKFLDRVLPGGEVA